MTREEHKRRTTEKDVVVCEWVGLTKDEIIDIIIEAFGSPYDVAVNVEAKLKDKNT